MKLYMFYVGGDCGNSNIELHDIRFSVGERVEDCYADLRKQWWGDAASLHLDCWGEIAQVDGHDVELTEDNVEDGQPKLFFLNMGGYDSTQFEELHRNMLLVTPDARAARIEGLSRIRSWKQPHKDSVFEIEKSLDVSAAMRAYGYSLQLTKAETIKDFVFACGFVRLGSQATTLARRPRGSRKLF